MRFFTFPELKEKGFNYSQAHLWRLVKDGKFPAPVKGMGPGNTWAEPDLDQAIADRVARAHREFREAACSSRARRCALRGSAARKGRGVIGHDQTHDQGSAAAVRPQEAGRVMSATEHNVAQMVRTDVAGTEITKFTKTGGPLTKHIKLAADGSIISDGSACIMARGEAQRIAISDIEHFARLIAELRDDQAIALGTLRAGLPEQVPLVTKKVLNGADHAIARTGDDIVYRHKEPAFALLDYDTKGMPKAIAAEIKRRGGFWAALCSVIPALSNTARVTRHSTSAGLIRTDTGATVPGSDGLHVFPLVQDGLDIERFLGALHERCWLAGFGWMMIGAGGQLLERSIIDRMVGAPERLVFEGGPILEPPLQQDHDARRPIATAGEMLETLAACPPLSKTETAKLKELQAKERRRLASAAAKARASFIKEKSRALAKRRGLTVDAATRIIKRLCDGVLLPDLILPFDDPELVGCTVGDVLADPDRFEGATLADPLEGVDYGTCKAKILRHDDGTPWIHSFAHGRTKYKLTQDDKRLTIRIKRGEIARVTDEAEAALMKAAEVAPIMVRAGMLVRPIVDKLPASHGRTTEVTLLRQLSVANTIYLLNKHAAVFEHCDGRSKEWVVDDPPAAIAKQLLEKGQWHFPKVAGVITTPTLRPDGSILDRPGYDPATQMWYAPDSQLTVPLIENPTQEQAIRALTVLKALLVNFPFVTEVDEVVALAAILTAVLRGGFDVMPMFLFRAHDVGSGKSFLCDLISAIARGRPCPVITNVVSVSEMEKRLAALVLEGAPIISLDNCSGNIGGDLLCQITERRLIRIRILGKSEAPECEWRGALLGTGNNIALIGDMTRRGLVANLDAKVERAELRKFDFDPIERVLVDRGTYIAAAITIARAYIAAGSPDVGCDPLGSYGEWSKIVRSPLIWLGQEDPTKSMDQAREEDPYRRAVNSLITIWRESLKGKVCTAADLVAMAQGLPELHELLLQQAGTARGDIDVRRLGIWLQSIRGRIHDGHCIELVKASSSHGNRYALIGPTERGAN